MRSACDRVEMDRPGGRRVGSLLRFARNLYLYRLLPSVDFGLLSAIQHGLAFGLAVLSPQSGTRPALDFGFRQGNLFRLIVVPISVCLSVCVSVCLSFGLFFCLSVCMAACLSVRLSHCLSLSAFSFCLCLRSVEKMLVFLAFSISVWLLLLSLSKKC